MKFVTYNIQYSRGADDQFDIKRTAKAIQGADIVAMQEVERFWKRSGNIDQAEELSRLMPDYHWVFAPNIDLDASFYDGDENLVRRRRQFGLMVMSRWPIISKRIFPLPKFGAVVHHSTQTGLLETVIDVPTGPIRVYTVHFSHLGGEVRMPQVEIVLDIVARAPGEGGVWCGTHPVPSEGWTEGGEPPMPEDVIIAGDFNFEFNTPEYDRFAGPFFKNHGRMISRTSLRDTWVTAGNEESQGITRPPTPGAEETSKLTPKRIDYCFVNPSLNERVVNSWIDMEPIASDHQPVWVEFNMDN